MDHSQKNQVDPILLAEAVKEECIYIARENFIDASIRGLCFEGALEVALDAMQNIKTESLIEKLKND